MFRARILRREPIPLDAIEVEICAQEWAATAEYDALVDRAWSERLAQASHPIWDGTYYRVLNAEEWASGAERALRLGTIRYRYIATFPALHEDHARCGLEPLNHLSTVALVRTRDGHILFGRRARDGAIDLIGGGVQQDEMPVSSGADLECNLRKEIREETGIRDEDIEEIAGLGALYSGTSNVLLLAYARSGLSKAGAEARFAHREDQEMAEPVFVPEAELRSFLEEMTDYRRLIPSLLD